MKQKEAPLDILFEDDDGNEFWWTQCKVDGCSNLVTHDSKDCCYPHSRWYRPFFVPINRIIAFFDRTD